MCKRRIIFHDSSEEFRISLRFLCSILAMGDVMKLTMFQDGDKIQITSMDMDQDVKQRLLYLGLYQGAIIRLEKAGKKGKPFLLLVCDNLLMLRAEQICQIEGELVL